MAALRSAGLRALAALPRTPDLVILDGNHDWLTAPEEVGLLSFAAEHPTTPPVTTMIKADLASSVASASVLAKVERDELMITLADAEDTYARYGWGTTRDIPHRSTSRPWPRTARARCTGARGACRGS